MRALIIFLCLLVPSVSFAKDWWGNYENDDDKNGLTIMVRENNAVQIIFSKDDAKCRKFVHINGKGHEKGNSLQIQTQAGTFILENRGKHFQLVPSFKKNTKLKWEGDCGNSTEAVDKKFESWIQNSKLQYNERDI